jgi:hypothetical protein
VKLAAARPAAEPTEPVADWLARAAAVPDDGLAAWTACLAGLAIRFRCTSERLATLYRSRMAAGRVGPGRPAELHIDLFETDRLGWPSPAEVLPGSRDGRGVSPGGVLALAPDESDDEALFPWVFFDPAARRGAMFVRTAADLPPWSSGAPFALALHLAFAARGWRFVHAAAIGTRGAGVLIGGPGGVGKSATTLAGIVHGLHTVGDDYLVIEPGPEPVAWPVYTVLKQDPAGLSRAGLDRLVDRRPNWNGKVEVDLREEFPGCVVPSLTLRAILLPDVARARRTSIAPAAPTEAFSAIAASMLAQLPGARLAGFSFLTWLTRSLPAYHLRLSQDPGDVAHAIRELLER